MSGYLDFVVMSTRLRPLGYAEAARNSPDCVEAGPRGALLRLGRPDLSRRSLKGEAGIVVILNKTSSCLLRTAEVACSDNG